MTESDTEQLEEIFVSRAQARIINYFLNNSGKPLRISRISRAVDFCIMTVHRVAQNLVRLGLVIKTKADEKTFVYTLAKNTTTKLLTEFLQALRMEESLDET